MFGLERESVSDLHLCSLWRPEHQKHNRHNACVTLDHKTSHFVKMRFIHHLKAVYLSFPLMHAVRRRSYLAEIQLYINIR